MDVRAPATGVQQMVGRAWARARSIPSEQGRRDRAHRGAGVRSLARRQAHGRVEELVGAVRRDAVTGEGEEGRVRAHIEK